jgi:SPP1 family predicted phage head-tail adaptor
MRHRIALQSPTVARDAYGQPIETFATYATVWAAIQPLSMRERLQSEQLEGERSHRITIRYNSSIGRTHRALFGSRIFEIVSILNNDERNATMELLCKEVV